jgi:signal transduction histidine kinase
MLDPDKRNLIVANRVARIMSARSFAFGLLRIVEFGITVNTPLIFSLGLFFALIPSLHKRGYGNIGRFLLCILPSSLMIVAALLPKLFDDAFTDILYYDTRFFLVLIAIVPCLIFSTSERIQLYSCLGYVLALLILFDPIHELLGVGYYQRGFIGTSYYYINYAACAAFFGISAGAISLRHVVEKTEEENRRYRDELIQSNQQLQELVQNVETQNEEISAQSDELQASQEQLMNANAIIEKQKNELQLEVKKINSELVDTNEELVKHNNELTQFSYTISHNLRGPIARLLGLANLAHLDHDVSKNDSAMGIINRIKTAAKELDHVVHDLNAIVDIRNEIYQVRETISFMDEWEEVKALLQIENDPSVKFIVDFQSADSITSIRPMISSIIFNLLSNAIKYQSPERVLHVFFKTSRRDGFTIIEVSDNGLGIDLGLFEKDLFKMYKRFHFHQQGKGLGLYLIRLQAEYLNGFVEVQSVPDQGSVFKVYIKDRTV